VKHSGLRTREQIAEQHRVHPVTVDLWTSMGMPTAGEAPDSGDPRHGVAPPLDWRISRRKLAAQWGRHPETLSHWINAEGLKAAVVVEGGHGRETYLDERLATIWFLARENRLDQITREDFMACSEHGIVALHQLPATAILTALATVTAPRRRRAPKGKPRTNERRDS
jgi:hypothetical protein